MKKKKNLIAVVLLVILSVGVTIAYLQSTDVFENIFNAGTYSVITQEEFVSPDNWKPGDTIPKTITTTNEGTIPVRVRIKLEQEWTSANGDELPLEYNYMNPAILNVYDSSHWIFSDEDGYAYYIDILEPGDSTLSPIESVTFNPDYEGNIICTFNSSTNSNECASSDDGYMGGTYTLTITTETIQADAAESEWDLTDYYAYTASTEDEIYNLDNITGYSLEEDYQSTNKDIFIRHKVFANKVVQSDIGFIYNNNVYYLKGVDSPYLTPTIKTDTYNENKNTLLNVFGINGCTEYESYDGYHILNCGDSDNHIHLTEYGSTSVARRSSDFTCQYHSHISLCIDEYIE